MKKREKRNTDGLPSSVNAKQVEAIGEWFNKRRASSLSKGRVFYVGRSVAGDRVHDAAESLSRFTSNPNVTMVRSPERLSLTVVSRGEYREFLRYRPDPDIAEVTVRALVQNYMQNPIEDSGLGEVFVFKNFNPYHPSKYYVGYTLGAIATDKVYRERRQIYRDGFGLTCPTSGYEPHVSFAATRDERTARNIAETLMSHDVGLVMLQPAHMIEERRSVATRLVK